MGKDDQPREPKPARGRAARTLISLARRRMGDQELQPGVEAAGVRVLDQAERVLARLEGVASTLESAARLELRLLERMLPIVDDLGELVRHSLDEARERRGLTPRRGQGSRRGQTPRVIDVEPE